MNTEDPKKSFGEDYPEALSASGVRVPLRRETRFTRVFSQPDKKGEYHISRFMDGSASITASELQLEWPTWTGEERMDFCQSCCWLKGQADFPEMLRIIMQHAGPKEWSSVAMSVASELPQDEAFDILLRALRTTDLGRTSNIGQAIAMTKHPDAEPTLRRHLDTIWVHAALWDDAEFINLVAFDATTCIAHLVELGAPQGDFEERVRQLAGHACARNRDSCQGFLSKYYSWLK